MIKTEEKKFKGLGLNYLFLAMFLAHFFAMAITAFDKSFLEAPYPYFSVMDSYLLFSLIFNPIFISSLVKRVIEMEEKNNMWAMQVSLGLSIKKILLDKTWLLSIRLFLLQTLEGLLIFILGSRARHGLVTPSILGRISFLLLSLFLINLFFIVLFTLIEIRFSQVYFSPLFSIIGSLTGIICMLTSKTLSLVNPFAWTISLMNISFIKEQDRFTQVLNPIQVYTLPIVLLCLLVGFYLLKKASKIRLKREI